MPSPLIYSLANCEVSSVMNFLNAKNVALIEIHRQMCLVYGVDVMSKQMIRRWCRAFSRGSKMSMTNNAAAGYHSSMTTSLSRCSNAFCRTVTFRLRNSLDISRKYHNIWCMKHPKHRRSGNCAPGGCRRTLHLNTQSNAWKQHWLFCSNTTMRATSFSTG